MSVLTYLEDLSRDPLAWDTITAEMTAPGNRHEQRRRSTHEALRQAALKSFAHKGFGNVTVTELAREAGVTERTFFRHFPTKEAVLFQDYETQLEWLAEALAQRPPRNRCSMRCWPASPPSRTTSKWYAKPRPPVRS
jgi:AcrR family transcriptional regulator